MLTTGFGICTHVLLTISLNRYDGNLNVAIGFVSLCSCVLVVVLIYCSHVHAQYIDQYI